MLTKPQLAAELLRRREARKSFRAWCILNNCNPAIHHDLIIKKFQEVALSPTPRYVILEMPPGAAKSTYTSVLAPPWYLGVCPTATILACSYSKDLAISFGRKGRNLVEEKHTTLGYSLKPDTRAADEWETTLGGRYFCAGVGAGIAGHRADLGLIDDPIGSQEDADSANTRKKQFDWFKADFYPRLKPNASIFIIANRRHELDLIGELTRKGTSDNPNESPIPPEAWEVIRIPFFAEQNDPLGREVGARLWPEWFTEKKAEEIRRINPRIRSGLYQQRPAPEEGDYFNKAWLQPYVLEGMPNPHGHPVLPRELRKYAASDHAVSKRDEACPTCMWCGGLSAKGDLFMMPDIFWKRADTAVQVENMFFFHQKWKELFWLAEKEHILQSIGPFLKRRMKESGIYIPIKEIVPKKDKQLRARSFQGLCATGRVYFPTFADWWPEAELQFLTFPGSAEADVVDVCGHIGKFIDGMTNPERDNSFEVTELPMETPTLTYGWLKESSARREKKERELQYQEN